MQQNLLRFFLDDVKIEEIMSRTFVKVYEDEPVSIVQEKFIQHNASHMVVVDRNQKLTGVISRKYVYKTRSPRKIIGREVSYDPNVLIDGESYYEKETLDGLILKNIMNQTPFTLTPEDTATQALANIAKKQISFIPVIDGNRRVVGTLSDYNVISFIARVIC